MNTNHLRANSIEVGAKSTNGTIVVDKKRVTCSGDTRWDITVYCPFKKGLVKTSDVQGQRPMVGFTNPSYA